MHNDFFRLDSIVLYAIVFLHYHIFNVRKKLYVDDEDNDDELDEKNNLCCCCRRRRLFALLCSQIPTLLRKFNGNKSSSH